MISPLAVIEPTLLDYRTWSWILAAMAPFLCLALAMFVQVRRDNLSFPPEDKKILRPSGYSLSLQLDTLIDSMLFRVML